MAEHDAMMWKAKDGQTVACELCGQRCVIQAGKYGLCRVRQNVAGQLKTLNYGMLVALNVDPIEKKPLFHVLPGSRSLSIAAAGCNFQCEFCQNWQISQSPQNGGIRGQASTAKQVVVAAANYDCSSIAYTYTEPTIFFEFAYDCAQLAGQEGIKNVFVSNGFLTPQAIETIAPHLDAINVDLKAFKDETYRKVMKASLQPVLDCLVALKDHGVWTEVTTLIVPDMNDSPEELRDLASFLSQQLGPQTPWHVSRFHGDYKMQDRVVTPIETLQMACAIGQEAGLKHIYCGNVHGRTDENTYCPNCGDVVVRRVGFSVRQVCLTDGRCDNCSQPVAGIWS
ncbi:MAG: AmmeMemoRadiSam system radical SAM enzyme [Phycisphaerae bacterium]